MSVAMGKLARAVTKLLSHYPLSAVAVPVHRVEEVSPIKKLVLFLPRVSGITQSVFLITPSPVAFMKPPVSLPYTFHFYRPLVYTPDARSAPLTRADTCPERCSHRAVHFHRCFPLGELGRSCATTRTSPSNRTIHDSSAPRVTLVPFGSL